MTDVTNVRVEVNGRTHEASVSSRRSLSDFLRGDIGLTGTHVGCEHGVCGACTVVVDGVAVRSCLLFAVQVDGAKIQTVEGLAKDGEMHALQQAFQSAHALQCGFCTPGLLMNLSTFLEESSDPTEDEIREAVSAHLCRCTGYVPILAAVKEAAMMISKSKLTKSDG